MKALRPAQTLLRARVDDAAERRADVLGIATHRAVVEAKSLRHELLDETRERHAKAKLLRQHVRDARRREQPPSMISLGTAAVTNASASLALVTLYFTRAIAMRTGPPRRQPSL